MAAENPYFSRQTIHDPRYFVGRKAELRQAFSIIGAASPQCVSVVGERRVGKSSFLRHLGQDDVRREYLTNPDRYVFVHIGLGEMGGMEESELWAEISREVVTKAGCDLEGERGAEERGNGSVAAAYDRVKACVEQLQSQGRVLILLLDDLEAIVRNEKFGFDSLGRLRALTNTYDVAIVTSTKLALADTCHRTDLATSPFFNVFGTTVTLGSLDPAGVKALVVGMSEKAGCPLEPDHEWIRELAGDLPYLLQLVCSEVFTLRTQRGKISAEELTPAERQEVERASYDHALGVFEVMWRGFSDEAREVLRLAARAKAVPARLERTAADLGRRGLLRNSRVSSKLFARYVSEAGRGDGWPAHIVLIILGMLLLSALLFYVTYVETQQAAPAIAAVAGLWFGGGLIKFGMSLLQQKSGDGAEKEG